MSWELQNLKCEVDNIKHYELNQRARTEDVQRIKNKVEELERLIGRLESCFIDIQQTVDKLQERIQYLDKEE